MDKDYFADGLPPLLDSGIEIDVEAIAQALVNIYKQTFDIDHTVEENLYRETCRIFDEAINNGMADAAMAGVPLPSKEFLHELQHNTEVFSAFRVHRMQKDIAATMVDNDGHLKSFRQFVKDASAYIDHRNRAWLQTEYDTAVLRAQNAAEWKEFRAEADVYPNLEWIPSTSPNPGADHRVFWGTVRPVNDPFWNEHKPGDRWNCKCELRQTERSETPVPHTAGEQNAQAGLETNPADGQIFSRKHPYYPQNCTKCPFAGNKLAALIGNLAGRRDCNQCSRASKCVERAKRHVKQREQKQHINPKETPEQFIAKQRELLQTLRKQGELELRNRKALYTGNLFFGKREFKRIKEHCYNAIETEAAAHLHSLLRKVEKGRYLPIDMTRKNYRRKIADGVKNYTVYEVVYKGEVFELKCQVKSDKHNGVAEYPYSIKQKRR